YNDEIFMRSDESNTQWRSQNKYSDRTGARREEKGEEEGKEGRDFGFRGRSKRSKCDDYAEIGEWWKDMGEGGKGVRVVRSSNTSYALLLLHFTSGFRVGERANRVEILWFHYHFLVNVQISHDITEFSERNLAIVVSVVEEDRLIDNLLQLSVLQIRTNHHLEHLKRFSVGYESVPVHIVDAEGKFQLGVLVSLHGELGNTLDELSEINFSVSILIKNVDNSLHERILLKLGKRHELFNRKRTAAVNIQLLEATRQSSQLIRIDFTAHLHGKRALVAHIERIDWEKLQWG
ncbi:hypothetical protein PFISCL1PPCAC_1270, partial [Pristionchus fissidentatus]